MASLASGDFYSSSGVELAELDTNKQSLRIVVKQSGTTKYSTDFIGPKGKLLSRIHGLEASYKIKREQYVRAIVRASNGDEAWVQPVHRN